MPAELPPKNIVMRRLSNPGEWSVLLRKTDTVIFRAMTYDFFYSYAGMRRFFSHFGNDWYFMLSLLKFPCEIKYLKLKKNDFFEI